MKRKGFALIELLVVIAIIAILAAILLPSFCLPLLSGGNTSPLKIEKLLIAPLLPTKGERVKFRATIVNEGDNPLKSIKLSLSLREDGKETDLNQRWIDQIKPKERLKIELGEWIPKENGLYELKLTAKTMGQFTNSSLRFAVVERKVEFAWYGTPKGLRWATLSTTIEKDYIEEWLWEGRTPLAFKPGVCFWSTHRDAPIEQLLSCWSEIPEGAEGIGIDEYGEGEAGNKLQSAIKLFKEKHPNLRVALWTGIPPKEIAPYVDYFLPECYLNYYGMHLGVLERFLREIKDKGLERKTLLSLGINYAPNKGMLLTTPEELEAQFRMIKNLCPDILGVGIFHYGSVPELDRLADELFYRYFVLPLLTYEWEIKQEGRKFAVVGQVLNIGNMDGKSAEVVLLADGQETRKRVIKGLKVGESTRFSFILDDLRRGFHIIEVKLKADSQTTVLDNEKAEAIGIDIVALKQGKGLALWLPACPHPRKNQPLRFPLPKGWNSGEVFLYNPQGEPERRLASQRNSKGELIWVEENIPAGENRFYIIYPWEKAEVPTFLSKETFEFANSFYQATLDISKDEITKLKVSGENLLSSPWRIDIHPPFDLKPVKGEARFKEGAVFKEVIVPLEGEGLRIESSYIFYLNSPLIEIRREIIPEGNLELDSAREGAGFPQKGGVFQAFAGEGAMRVSKGKLENGEQYRDIYFGYGGNSPAPENSQKTGWFDFCWDEPALGLGIAIIKRWMDSKSRTYDVTRYYDGGDWVDVFYIFQTTAQIKRPQESFILLLPHKSCNLEREMAPIVSFYWTERKRLKMVSLKS